MLAALLCAAAPSVGLLAAARFLHGVVPLPAEDITRVDALDAGVRHGPDPDERAPIRLGITTPKREHSTVIRCAGVSQKFPPIRDEYGKHRPGGIIDQAATRGDRPQKRCAPRCRTLRAPTTTRTWRIFCTVRSEAYGFADSWSPAMRNLRAACCVRRSDVASGRQARLVFGPVVGGGRTDQRHVYDVPSAFAASRAVLCLTVVERLVAA